MAAPPETWFVFRTAPQKELASHRIMTNNGFLSYTPLRQEYRFANRYARARRRKSLKSYPLMVGYLFVCLPPAALGWFCLYQKPPCILNPVGLDGQPITIPHRVMQHMVAEHGGSEHIAPAWERFMRTHREFAVGDTVEIMEGPMRGNTITVEEIRGDKAKAFIEMFGQAVEINIPLIDLEIAEAAE